MAEHLTEEEQLEALKRWWNENGKSLLTMLLIGIAAYSGYQFWQGKQQSQDIAGSAVYEQLLEAMAVESRTAEQTTTAKYLAEQLQNEHSGTFYGISGAMFLAKLAVEDEQLVEAEKQLKLALDQGPSDAMSPLLWLRLAKVQLAQDNYAAAQGSLDKGQTQAFLGVYAEARGDIFFAQNDIENARGSYQLAIDSLLDEDFNRKQLLQVKLNSLPAAGTQSGELN